VFVQQGMGIGEGLAGGAGLACVEEGAAEVGQRDSFVEPDSRRSPEPCASVA